MARPSSLNIVEPSRAARDPEQAQRETRAILNDHIKFEPGLQPRAGVCPGRGVRAGAPLLYLPQILQRVESCRAGPSVIAQP